MRSHFKGVVWPKKPIIVNGDNLYRYVVTGVVVTDKPLEFLEGKQQVLLDGHAFGLPESLNIIRQRSARVPCSVENALEKLREL